MSAAESRWSQAVEWSSKELAQKAAVREAMRSQGVVLSIECIEPSGGAHLLVGTVPMTVVRIDGGATGRPMVRTGLSQIHLCPSALERGEPAAFAVLQGPLVIEQEVSACEGGAVRIAYQLHERWWPPTWRFGSRACVRCNGVIPEGRLRAQPLAQTCVPCALGGVR